MPATPERSSSTSRTTASPTLDLSAGVPFTAGVFSITPVLHVVITGDDSTKVTSPTNIDSDAKLWGGVSLSWSNEAEEEEPEAPAAPE